MRRYVGIVGNLDRSLGAVRAGLVRWVDAELVTPRLVKRLRLRVRGQFSGTGISLPSIIHLLVIG